MPATKYAYNIMQNIMFVGVSVIEIREFNWKMKKKNMEKLSLVPRPICGRGKNGLVSIVCACAEYSTIRGVSDLYVNSP